MADRKFLDFLDMIDGGGAGRMGDKFEGGGLFSALGNLVASPYGSQDEERRKARMAFYGSDNIGGAPTAAPSPVRTAGSMAPAPIVPPTEQERLQREPLEFPQSHPLLACSLNTAVAVALVCRRAITRRLARRLQQLT